MPKYRSWFIALVLVLFVLMPMFVPRIAAFQYIHNWRVNISGSLVVSGNQSLPITPYWDSIGNRTWQVVEQLSFIMIRNNETIDIVQVTTDVDGNPRFVLNLTSPLEPQDTLQWYEEWVFQVSDHRPSLPQISLEQSGTVNEIEGLLGTEDYFWYTRGTSLWKTGNISLLDLAQQIRNQIPEPSQSNVLALVYAAVDWIQSNIYRSIGLSEPQYPEETIVSQVGDCDDQSNLLITLLRIFNIPCYLLTGHWFQEGTRTSGFVWGSIAENAYLYVDWKNSIGHGWAMVYVPPWGWLPFDLTAAGQGVNPSTTYTDSLYSSGVPFVTLWQIVASDYIAERRIEEENLFTYQLHITDFEDWTNLGSIPVADFYYFATNLATLGALIITLGFFGCLVGIAARRRPTEEVSEQ